jgi:predicted tellurium resistance membrane protein TerC
MPFFSTVQWDVIAKLALLDATLGINNIVGIAPICAALVPGQRVRAIAGGCVLAWLLRGIMLCLAQFLNAVPHLALFAGAYLMYLGYRAIQDRSHAHRQRLLTMVTSLPARPTAHAPAPVPTRTLRAVRDIAFADAALSIDNVLAVAALAHVLTNTTAGTASTSSLLTVFGHAGWRANDYAIVGVAISIPLVMLCAAMLAPLLARSLWLTWCGAGLLGCAGATLALHDTWLSAVRDWIAPDALMSVQTLAGLAGFVGVIGVTVLIRRWQEHNDLSDEKSSASNK